MFSGRQCVQLTVPLAAFVGVSIFPLAVSKALEQLDTSSREAAAAKQRAEQLEHELARTQQQAQSAQAQVDRCDLACVLRTVAVEPNNRQQAVAHAYCTKLQM